MADQAAAGEVGERQEEAMRTLLTGFGPFGTVVNNPSARIVEHFAREGAPGHALATRVLPVSFTRAEREIVALLRAGRFDVALLLGVAGGEAHVRLERFGRNQDRARLPDCDGFAPMETVIRLGAPSLYPATLEPEPLAESLRAAGIPTRLSDDAGGYVCNHTYFAALHALAEANLPTRCLFVHVPWDALTFSDPPNGPTMPLDRQIQAIRHMLRRLRYFGLCSRHER